jgi:FdhD protein
MPFEVGGPCIAHPSTIPASSARSAVRRTAGRSGKVRPQATARSFATAHRPPPSRRHRIATAVLTMPTSTRADVSPDVAGQTRETPRAADDGAVRRRIVRVRQGHAASGEDWIAAEIPVALHYNGQPHVVMMATPADLEDFALGFSLSEAVIADPSELRALAIQPLLEGIEVAMTIPAARAESVAARQRNLTGRSSCGLCGTQALEDVVRHPPPVGDGPVIDEAAVQRALGALGAAQPVNALTGATHAAAWADPAGALHLVREDVGRHNALDKLIGAMARARIDAAAGFLVVTSRASYEMVQKAAGVGITIMVAISAPTALAIHLADSANLTLIGFARRDGHAVYTHPHRITASEP